MPKKSGKKKRMTGDERRADIVEKAERLFSQRGFKGTTTRAIAEEAAISEATIFKYFSRKEDLYKAIIDRCCNDPGGSFILTSKFKGLRGKTLFTELATFIIGRYSEDPSFSRLLMFSALERSEFSDMFFNYRGVESFEFLSSEIERLIKEGLFTERDPKLSARAFLGMIAHYCMLQEIYGFKKFFERSPEVVVETFVGIFFDGMKRREGTEKGGRGD